MKLGVLSAFGGGLLLLYACQPRYLPVDQAGRITATPPEPAAAPPPVPPPPSVATPAVETPRGPPASQTVAAPPAAPPQDRCGALGLRYLVGKPRTQIPVPVDLSKRRVECTTCTAAADPDPDRVTIRYDQSTGLVTEVICR